MVSRIMVLQTDSGSVMSKCQKSKIELESGQNICSRTNVRYCQVPLRNIFLSDVLVIANSYLNVIREEGVS